MRRPQLARGLVAVLASLLVLTIEAVPASALIAPAQPEPVPSYDAPSKTCTKWSSTMTPPRTIKVLRTAATSPPAKVKGTVQTVDFYEYVATVMAAEWPEKYPVETIKAGAIATKQFAWYHIKVPRGGVKWKNGTKDCYDVVDSTIDQWYRPEKFGPDSSNWPVEGSKIRQAMDLTWDQSLRKYRYSPPSSRFFLTGYRAGSGSAACGEDATGFKLFHNSTRKCGYAGWKYREILRRYLNPSLEIVTPGANDVIGTKHGDASAMQHSDGQRTTRVWTPGQTAPEGGSYAGLTLPTDGLIDYVAGDLDGDGRQDLAWLRKTGASGGVISVALSDGTNYGPAQDWWSGDTIVPVNGADLLIGDFHGDGREDVAIFGRGDTDSTSRLVVLKRSKYDNPSRLSAPVLWWEASQEFDKVASVWLGDLSGDGRSDLIVRQNVEGGGVRLKTAVTKSPLPSSFPRMGTYKARWEDTTLVPAKVKMTVGDADRDGRDDVMMLVGGGGQAVLERLQGRKLGGLKRVRVWTAPKSDPIPVAKTRLGAADIDYDGREDYILFSQRGTGTRIRILKARYDKAKPGPDWRIGTAWADIRPY
jgi:Stage II sporulation protein